MVPLQQQIHAQQVPGGPPQPMGALNPFGALGATMGLPHGPQGLLNKPPEHHRPDIKPTGLEGPAAAEERLVSSPSPARPGIKILQNSSRILNADVAAQFGFAG